MNRATFKKFLVSLPVIILHGVFFAALFSASIAFAGPGRLDTTFGNSGVVTTDLGVAGVPGRRTGGDYANALAIQPDGKIIAAGYTYYDRWENAKCSAVRYNTNGALDTGFSGDGKLFPPMDFCVAVIVQSDGKIVFVGNPTIAIEENDRTIMARYTEAGDLDASFGTGGKVSLPEEYYTIYNGGPGIIYDEPHHQFVIADAALQDDGKIVAVGTNSDPDTEGERDFLLLRYNANGSLDGSFGSGGMITTDFDNGFDPDIDGVSAIAISDSGKIAVTGASTPSVGDYPNYKYSTAVYDEDGNLEWKDSFAPDISSNFPSDIAFDPNGRILVAGSSNDGATEKLTLVRYNDGGGLDLDFGSEGVAKGWTMDGTEGKGLLLSGDGSIFALGNSYTNNGQTDHVVLMKFTSEGELGASFGTNGAVSTNLGKSVRSSALGLQEDGRIIANARGGIASKYSATSVDGNFNLLRYVTRPVVSIGAGRATESAGKEVPAAFTLTLDAAADDTVTVDYETSDLPDFGDSGAVEGDDYGYASGTVQFESGETSKTINIAIYDDEEMEDEEYFLVTLSSPTNADILSPGAYGIITDNDWPSLSIEDVEVTEGNAGEEQVVTFEITLTRPPASDPSEVITVEYETDSDNADGGADFEETSGSLIFDAGVTSQTVEVTVLGDDEIEDDEYFSLTLYDAEGAQISDGLGEAVIHDNDEEAGDAGDGGGDPGDGGADPGDGGGDGGGDPGDGGADPGDGGGDGGGDPGDGGADPGDGGGDEGDGEGDEDDEVPADDCSARPFVCRGVNPVTGETACPEVTADANCDFALECDQDKLIDPTDQSKVVAEINCEYNGTLIQMLYDADASGLRAGDGSIPRFQIGDMDIYDTISYHVIDKKIDEMGWRAMRESTSGLGCCQAFARDLFGGASGSNGNEAMMAGIARVAGCLAGRLPDGYTISDVYALLTNPDSDSDETGSIIDFAIARCGLEGSIKNAIMNGRSALSSVGDLCLTDIAGDETTCEEVLENEDERQAWVNTIHALDESELENYDDTIPDLIEMARATSDLSLFADDFRIDMLVGLMDGNNIISGLDEDMLDTVMDLVRNVPEDNLHDAHDADWYRGAGSALLDLIAGSDDDILDYLRANAGDLGDMIHEQEGETSDDIFDAVSDYLSERGHEVDNDRAGRNNRGNDRGQR